MAGIATALLVACLGRIPLALADAAGVTDSRQALLTMLDQQTELATNTRLNADYVPGILDILHGDDLESRGARTVWDALGFVPGIVPVMDQTGHRRITVRGLGAVGDNWTSGYVKVLLNGIEVNTADRGLADPIYYMPIAQIERIEVIRGPDSAVHGEYAVAAVINIVTRQNENRAFAFGGSFNEAGGGAILHTAKGKLHLSLNFSAWKSDGADVRTGNDSPYQYGQGITSYAPGRANEGIVARNGVAKLDYGNFTLIGQWTQSELGDYFGINYILPPDHNRLVERKAIQQVEGRYHIPLPGGKLSLFYGNRRYRAVKSHLFASPSETFGISSGPDIYVNGNYEEVRRYGGMDLTLERGKHQGLLGLYRSRIDVPTSWQTTNLLYDSVAKTFKIVSPPVASSIKLKPGTARSSSSIVVQDEYRASDRFSITTGARYDDYSGVGTSISPRIAGVWRFGEQEVIKAQYGRAFRPPTLSEMSYNASLKPVTTDTAELGYIRKFPRGEWRATAAYSRLNDIIIFDATQPPHFFVNANSGSLRTLELEGNRQLGRRLKARGGVAYTDTELGNTHEPIPGASRWSGRVGMGYRMSRQLQGDLEYHFVSGFARQPTDPRSSASGYGVTDLTLTGKFFDGLSLRGGVANLFDVDVRYPAFMATDPSNKAVVSYPGDMPRPGRTWWLQLSADF